MFAKEGYHLKKNERKAYIYGQVASNERLKNSNIMGLKYYKLDMLNLSLFNGQIWNQI